MTARFVVGTGRCGSTMLSSLLSTHPGVLSLSEPLSSLQPRTFPDGEITPAQFWSILSEPDPIWTAALRAGATSSELRYPFEAGGRFSRETGVAPIAAVCLPSLSDDPDGLYDEIAGVVRGFPTADAGVLYGLLFDWLAARFGRQAWVERSGASLRYVEHTIRHFPGARFLHLYRDGVDTAVSMSRHPSYRIYIATQMQLEGAVADDVAAGGLVDVPIPIERFGRHWSAMILHGTRRLAALGPGRVRHVAYEDLVADPRTQLMALAEHLELPDPPPGWLEGAAARVEDRPRPARELSDEERARLERACEPGRRRLRRLAPA